MLIALGFAIALAIGITGVGGGTITVPLLMLFVRLAPAETVGTALTFAAVVKLVAAPMYLVRRQVNFRILWLMLLGGLPGLVLGLYALNRLHAAKQNTLLTILLGALIIVTALLNIFKTKGVEGHTGPDRRRWLPWLMLPIGAETGFSSAGSGALGTLALLNFTTLTPVQVVGTDVLFGLALSLLGGGVQLSLGAYNQPVLTQLLIGGVAGALIGPNLTAWLPAKPLRVALCIWLVSLGSILCLRAGA
jgi:uncharacterized membrane protein YfcA